MECYVFFDNKYVRMLKKALYRQIMERKLLKMKIYWFFL